MTKNEIVSIIIPVYNEQECIANLIQHLRLHAPEHIEIIVSDGGSTDATTAIASAEGAILVRSPQKGRAAQMNFGASIATGSILYFVHADCLPPQNFYAEIIESVNKDFHLGRFQTKFDSNSLLLKLNAVCTRFDWFICYGGDQTLFITTDAFKKINGFCEDMLIMEDYDIVKRARKQFQYAVLKQKVLVSARKYETNSWLKVQLANRAIVKMFRKGIKQEVLVEKYKQLLDYRY